MSAPSRQRTWRPPRRTPPAAPPSPGVPLRAEQPAWIAPMLATLVEPRALPEGWVYEPKLDGVRCVAVVTGDGVRLFSRNRRPLHEAYPEIVEGLRSAVRGTGIFDGEIVATDPESGSASFALLQRRMQLRDAARARRSGIVVQYWLFDCMFYEGRDLRRLALGDRRTVLRDAVHPGGPVRLTPVWTGDYDLRYEAICGAGGEGLIGKRLASPYVSGRSRDWVKLKCGRTGEFVIVGWTDPKGSREQLGALLLGYYDEGGCLRYAGRVGTGLDRDTLRDLARLLARRARRTSPLRGAPPLGPGVHWVTPTLVAEVGFAEWTPGGLLRHPRFVGLRRDRRPPRTR